MTGSIDKPMRLRHAKSASNPRRFGAGQRRAGT
jgi:hypothetical protein